MKNRIHYPVTEERNVKMEQSHNLQKPLAFADLILILLCAAGCVYIFASGCGVYYILSAAAELLSLIFSVLYFVKGFQKDAAKYYRLFLLFYALTYPVEVLAAVLGYEQIGVSSVLPVSAVFSMLLYGNTLILAVGKDLGKKVSYLLCGINVFSDLIPVIGCMIPGAVTFANEKIAASSIILYCTWLILSLNAFVMTAAKYRDKAARGTN